MLKFFNKNIYVKIFFIILFAITLLFILFYVNNNQKNIKAYNHYSFTMSTILTQDIYGEHAKEAALEVEAAFIEFEKTLSLYETESEIAKINAAAGKNAVQVSNTTLNIIKNAKELSLNNSDAFALTLAPLSLAWGFTSENAQILHDEEINKLLPLIDDNAIIIDEDSSTVMLLNEGMAIDLGAVAKGAACNLAKDIYNEYNIKSAYISIGGNIYVHGKKPDGTQYRIGFRDATASDVSALAAIELTDKVFAVSGTYERFFEEGGETYHHILDPKTGKPANSDIVSVGIIHEDGAVADFYSTALFVSGKQSAIDYFTGGGSGIFLDNENNIYVSKDLEGSFDVLVSGYNIIFV